MKRMVFWGSVVGTIVALVVACFFVLATLVWLVFRWNPAPWVVWSVGLSLAAVVVAAVWRWWRLPVERRFCFSLRGMLVGISLFSLWLGLAGMDVLRWGRMRAVLADLSGHGVTVDYYYHWPREPLVDLSLRVFGYDLSEKIVAIEIRRNQGLAALLEHVDDFPALEGVNFWGPWISDAGIAGVEQIDRFPNLQWGLISGCMITDSGLKRLCGCRQLEELHLHNCAKITDAGLAHLKRLPNLRFLRLLQENAGTMPVTDAGLAHVADLQQLEELMIVRIPVTDAGLAHVARLPQLKVLVLSGIPATNDGIAQLRKLENIERIYLRNTQVTEQGVNSLCAALPDCLVTWEDEIHFPAVCQIRQIEVWDNVPHVRLLATIADRERIGEIKEWLDKNHARLQKTLTRNRESWKHEEADGPSGACLSVRFEGRNRRLSEIRLGNGVYDMNWGSYCPMGAAEEEQIRPLLGIDAAEWTTK